MQLEGKAAIVTGAGGGIGRAISRAFALEGAGVALVDLDEASLEQTRQEVESTGRRALPLTVDLTQPGAIDAMVEQTVAAFGKVDVLINNAGITWHKDFFDIEEEDWDRIHHVNARAAFFVMQRVAKQMVAQGEGGRIVNTASIAAKGFRETSNAAYAASKGAVLAMTLIAAHAVAEHSINVNAICPGVTRTPMFDGMMSRRSVESEVPVPELEAELAKTIPIQRFNEAEDIAALAVYLAGPGSRNITGQSINVDGGLVMH
jgi:NAD(P)-dependent dehydrogenase (short-subunit alcohol dehydrogenase family)